MINIYSELKHYWDFEDVLARAFREKYQLEPYVSYMIINVKLNKRVAYLTFDNCFGLYLMQRRPSFTNIARPVTASPKTVFKKHQLAKLMLSVLCLIKAQPECYLKAIDTSLPDTIRHYAYVAHALVIDPKEIDAYI